MALSCSSTAALPRYVLGNTKTEDPKHMYYLKRFISEALKCEQRVHIWNQFSHLNVNS